jgi:hypothetical protein
VTNTAVNPPLPEVERGVLPPDEVVATAPWAEEAHHWQNMVSAFDEAVADVRAHIATRDHAIASDRDALAAALAVGKADPGTKRTEKWQAEYDAKLRMVGGYNVAASTAHKALLERVRATGPEFLDQVRERRNEALKAFQDALYEAAEQIPELYHARQMDGWLNLVFRHHETFSRDALPGSLPAALPTVRIGGQSIDATALLEIMASAFAEG